MPTSEFLAIYSTEKIHLGKPLHVKELHVHLGVPGPVLDTGDHDLQYSKVEFHGRGAFTVLRNGRLCWKVER